MKRILAAAPGIRKDICAYTNGVDGESAMMGFTDELVGLDLAHKREMAANTEHAQGIVNQVSAELIRLRAVEKSLRAQLSRETARRIAAEARIEEILDTEV